MAGRSAKLGVPDEHVGRKSRRCGSSAVTGAVRLLDARIDQLSETTPRERVIQWGFVMSVLSDVWNAPKTTHALEVALLLDRRT